MAKGSRVNVRLVYWIAALYDHQPRLTTDHCYVLVCLVTRHLDYGTGAGYCSVPMLAKSTGKHRTTVMQALALAQELGLLKRTKRGHRLGNGDVHANEWQVIYPPMSKSQPSDIETRCSMSQSSDVEAICMSLDPSLKVALGPSQSRTGATPTGSEVPTGSEDSSLSSSLADLLTAAVPSADEREIKYAVTTIESRHAQGEIRSARAYLKKIISEGDAPSLIDEARAEIAVNGNGWNRGRHVTSGTSPRPGWCGSCNEGTRQIELDDGLVIRCPECHPLAAEAASL